MRVFFDALELYYTTQFTPVWAALRARGCECRLVHYQNRESELDALRRAFHALDVESVEVATKEEGLELYRSEKPDWILFGNAYDYAASLPPETRTAMLYHGTGTKLGHYNASQAEMDATFVAGPFYAEALRKRYPQATVTEVGYPKLDPLFGPAAERPRLDLEAVGLDPDKRTLLYAPTHVECTFPNMSDDWPADFEDFNLIVKPHQLSHFGTRRRAHRAKMDAWRDAPNCWIAPIDVFDPNPLMLASDLMISDTSGILFEFAALDRPVVWADIARVHWTRSGLLRWRYWKRFDRSILEFRDVAAHAPTYRELRGVVEAELATPERYARRRAEVTALRLGPTDGRAGERIAQHLLTAPDQHMARPASVRGGEPAGGELTEQSLEVQG